MLLVTLANFRDNSLDTVAELIRRDDVVLGLGDGGAHYGMICDASFPTYLLTHWVRDRESGPAVGRRGGARADVGARAGRRAWPTAAASPSGYKADLNVIDARRAASAQAGRSPTTCPRAAAASTRPPTATSRRSCPARSSPRTACPPTARPGKLIRGRQPAPATYEQGRTARSPVERRGRRGHQQLGPSRPHLRTSAAGALPAAASRAGARAAQARRVALRRRAFAAAGAHHRDPADLRTGRLRVRVGRAGGVLGSDRRRQRRRMRRAGHRRRCRGGRLPSAC